MYIRIRVREEVIERVQVNFFKHCKDKAGKMCKIIMSSLQKGSHHSTSKKKQEMRFRTDAERKNTWIKNPKNYWQKLRFNFLWRIEDFCQFFSFNFQDGEAWMLPVPAPKSWWIFLVFGNLRKMRTSFLLLLKNRSWSINWGHVSSRIDGFCSGKNCSSLHLGMFVYVYPILCKFGWSIGTLLHATLLNQNGRLQNTQTLILVDVSEWLSFSHAICDHVEHFPCVSFLHHEFISNANMWKI